MKSFFVFLCLSFGILLSGCGSQLREPFCKNPTKEFPVEFRGRYEGVVPSTSMEWSGNNILQTVQIEVGEKGLAFSVGHMQSPSEGHFCQVSGRIFIESQSDNGTYQVSEVAQFEHGIVLSILSVDIDLARKRGFPLHYLPTRHRTVKGLGNLNGTSLMEAKNLILDNTNIGSEDLLLVLKPVSMQTVLRRSTSQKAIQNPQVISLTAPTRERNGIGARPSR